MCRNALEAKLARMATRAWIMSEKQRAAGLTHGLPWNTARAYWSAKPSSPRRSAAMATTIKSMSRSSSLRHGELLQSSMAFSVFWISGPARLHTLAYTFRT
eukprot:3648473-Prymnesium_polylepis.1